MNLEKKTRSFYADLKCVEKGKCTCRKIFSKYSCIEEIFFYLITNSLFITFYEAFFIFFFTVWNQLQILYFSIHIFKFLQIKCLLCLFKSVYAKIAKNVLVIEEIFFFTKVAENSFYTPEFPLTQLTLSRRPLVPPLVRRP
jgi:hypothetical protein